MKPTRTDPAADLLERDRKAEHIKLALNERMQLERNFFEDLVFEHNALPEIDFEEIDTSVTFLGKRLSAPLVISCMTGGTGEATRINRNLAGAAEEEGIAFGVGSQRKAIEDPVQAASFEVRDVAPSIPILANLGAVQLNYGFGVDECRRAVEMIGADALVFHLNALQEAIQPEGQRNFKGLLPKMVDVARQLEVPVIIKEIGCGIAESTARELASAGFRILDTAGMGGTSWARIEGARARDAELGERFAGWGVPTTESIRRLAAIEDVTLIGSGGVRNGVDVAKAIALGSDLVGLAYPFLQVANESRERVIEKIRRVVLELKICMFCSGARSIKELQSVELRDRVEGSSR
jgi:isopentenyl-diphosphate delta-isomerase